MPTPQPPYGFEWDATTNLVTWNLPVLGPGDSYTNVKIEYAIPSDPTNWITLYDGPEAAQATLAISEEEVDMKGKSTTSSSGEGTWTNPPEKVEKK